MFNPSHTDESWEGRNTCMWIYIYIYIYIYITVNILAQNVCHRYLMGINGKLLHLMQD